MLEAAVRDRPAEVNRPLGALRVGLGRGRHGQLAYRDGHALTGRDTQLLQVFGAEPETLFERKLPEPLHLGSQIYPAVCEPGRLGDQ